MDTFINAQVLQNVSKRTLVSWICCLLILVEFSVTICSVTQYYAKHDRDNNQTFIQNNQTIFESGDINVGWKP